MQFPTILLELGFVVHTLKNYKVSGPDLLQYTHTLLFMLVYVGFILIIMLGWHTICIILKLYRIHNLHCINNHHPPYIDSTTVLSDIVSSQCTGATTD